MLLQLVDAIQDLRMLLGVSRHGGLWLSLPQQAMCLEAAVSLV